MSHKGVKPFEAHVEKIVLGVVVIALVGVVLWQFAGGEKQIRLGRQEIPITDAHEELARHAQQVQSEIRRSVEKPTLPEDQDPLQQYKRVVSGNVAPTTELAHALGSASSLDIGGGIGTTPIISNATYAIAQVPAPSSVQTSKNQGTIDPRVVRDTQSLSGYIEDPRVPDKISVSVEATFNSHQLGEMWENDPDGEAGPIQPIPGSWLRGRTQILAVELERQTLLDDGKTWGNTQIIPTPPGRLTFKPQLTDVRRASDLNKIVQTAAEHAHEVRRPLYYPHILGEPWRPPSEMTEQVLPEDIDETIQATRLRLENINRELTRLESRIQSLEGEGGGGARDDDRQPRNRDERRRERRPDRDQDDENQDSTDARAERQLMRLRKQRDDLQKDAKAAILKLRTIGEEVEEELIPVGIVLDEEKEATAEWKQVQDGPFFEDENIPLWTHDLTAERGKTYRYRMRVWVTNPFFGHSASLTKEQKSLAERPFLRSEPSPWSQPVNVDEESYFFVTSASSSDEINREARATTELYFFRWGYWRKAIVRLESGDKVVATTRVPDFSPFVEHLLNSSTPGLEEDELEYLEFTRANPALLLEVAPLPGATRNTQHEAFFRNAESAVITRTPEADTSALVYRRIATNARLGENQLTPVIPGEQPDRRPPGGRVPPSRDREPPNRFTPGG